MKQIIIAFVALATLFPGIQSYAYDAPWNGWREDITGPGPEPEEDCQNGECGPPNDCNTGSPVYTARGSLVWSDTDIRFPGVTRIGLQRTYNSFDFRAGMFGRGWFTAQESNIARTYKAVAEGSADGSATTAAEFESVPVWMSSYGRRYKLEESETACTPPQVLFFTFEKQPDGSFKQVFEESLSFSIYNDSGELLESYSDQSGSSIYYDYDEQGRLVRQYDSYGFALNFVYNERGFVEQVSDQAERLWSYSYDDYGNLMQVVDPDNNSRDYGYHLVDNKGYKQHLLNSVHDNLDEQVLSVIWSRSTLYTKKTMRVTSFTQRDGHRHDYSYAQTTYNGIPAVRVVKSSRQVSSNSIVESQTFIADANRYWILQQSSTTRGATLRRTFDSRGNLIERHDERGNTTRFEYNSSGRATRVTEMAESGSERITTISYIDNSNRVALIDEYGLRETRFTYDADRRMLSRTLVDLASGDSRTWNYGYHANSSDSQGNPLLGRLASVDGPQPGIQDRHTFFYNKQGLVSRVERPLGLALGYSYNTAGQLLAATDANDVTMEMRFDSHNRPLQITRGGRSTAIEYTAQGRIRKITDALGRAITLAYNDHDQPTQITYPSGDKLSFSYLYASAYTQVSSSYSRADGTSVSSSIGRYDPFTGLPQQSSLATAAEVAAEHQYNGLNDLLQTTLYGQFGNTTAASSSTFNYLYDSEGRLQQIRDGLDGVTTLSHDLFGRISQVTDANGGATQFDYSTWGELTQSNSPDSGSRGYEYDPAGNLLSLIDANGVQTSYSYDALSRLAGIDFAGDALDTVLNYDEGVFGKGRLTSVIDGSGSSRFQYDDRGQLLLSSTSVANRSFDVSYSYNDAGELTGIGYPSGAQVSYSHDNAGRLGGIQLVHDGKSSSLLGGISWNGPNMASYQQGNGIITELVYDSVGRLTEKRYGGNDNSLQLTLDRQGQITSQNWLKNGSSESDSYLYDHLGRLTQDGADSQAFSYDAAGNRLTRQKSGSSDSYSYDTDSNRLNQVETTVIQRDAVGSRLADGIRQYQYNAMNRLAQLNNSQTQIQAAYSYNFIGERVRKQLAGAQVADIRYVYGQGGELLGEYNSDGGVIREYIYLGDGAAKELIAQLEADGSIVTIHSDHLATPRLATKEDQTIVWRWVSDAFGTAAADEDPDGDGNPLVVNHRFPGQHYDLESGLHYNYHRYYDPQSGRYITSDPIGLAGGLNTYGYVGANPLKYTDPQGLFFDVVFDIGSIIYDVGKIIVDNVFGDEDNLGENCLALGADTAGAFIPGATGLGMAARGGMHAGDATKGLPTPSSGDTVYRVYGGDSMPGGASWSPVNPASVKNYRDVAGLPSGGASGFDNSGRFVVEGTLQDPSKVVKVRLASSLDRNKGGIPEYVIPDALSNGAVEVKRVSGVNPEF